MMKRLDARLERLEATIRPVGGGVATYSARASGLFAESLSIESQSQDGDDWAFALTI